MRSPRNHRRATDPRPCSRPSTDPHASPSRRSSGCSGSCSRWVAARPSLSLRSWLSVAFMGWGAYRTLPYIGTYGLDALRDAVTWAYGLFAIVIVATIRPRDYATLVAWYRKILPFFVVAMPIVAVVTQVFGDAIPKWPNTPSGGVGIIYFGNGHTGVHLAGVGAFILLGF